MATQGYPALKNLLMNIESRADDHVLTVNKATEVIRAQSIQFDNMSRAVTGTITQTEFDILTGYFDGFYAQAEWITNKYGVWMESLANSRAALAGLDPQAAAARATTATAASRKKG